MNKASYSKIGNGNPAWKGGPIERVCQTCGITFFAIRAKVPGNSYSDRTTSKSKYCSRECFGKSCIKNKIKKSCIVCLKEFEVIPAKKYSSKYCSVECKNISQEEKIEKQCGICDKNFIVIKSRKESAKYCSNKCVGIANKKIIPNKLCLHCGQLLKARNKYEANNKKYCSRVCDSLRRKKPIEYHRENQNRYDHLKRARKYNAEGHFTEEEWSLLKRQYHHRCLCCGRSEPDIKLTKDHIIPLTKGGTNWILNIQPLCRSCNSKKHNKIVNYVKSDNQSCIERN